MVVLADDLQDVAGVEGDPRLGAGDEIVIKRVVLELRPDEDIAGRRGRAVGGNDLTGEWIVSKLISSVMRNLESDTPSSLSQ